MDPRESVRVSVGFEATKYKWATGSFVGIGGNSFPPKSQYPWIPHILNSMWMSQVDMHTHIIELYHVYSSPCYGKCMQYDNSCFLLPSLTFLCIKGKM